MLYEPEIVIAHAKRAGLTLERTARGTVKVLSPDPERKLTNDWVDLLKRHRARILPLLPLHIEKAEPAKESLAPQAPYGLRVLPATGNYDLFDGVTPLCLTRNRRKAPQAAWPLKERRKAVHDHECPACTS